MAFHLTDYWLTSIIGAAGFIAASVFMHLCTPGMGVNLWGESPLYVNPVNMLNILTKVLAEGKGVIVR